MRNREDFPLTDLERLRLVDKLRFLVFGGAYKRRFAARAAEHGIVFSSRTTADRWIFATVSVALLLVIGWQFRRLREVRVRSHAMAVDLSMARQRRVEPQTIQQPLVQLTPGPPEVRIIRVNSDDALRGELEKTRAGSFELSEQLERTQRQLDLLRSEIDASRTAEARMADQLHEAEQRLSSMTPELAQLRTARTEDAATIAVQRERLREVSGRLNVQSETMDRERKLLVADLDIRELMGARSLHIVDVFDVDGKGKTQRPFGRVFYTEGKSLIFYAFDLKAGNTFQAWGHREAREESARSLGIFYVDDQKQNRWVLKFDDPKVLAEINAVFVTVEPPGGSVKPNRQKLLYAYLNASANHP